MTKQGPLCPKTCCVTGHRSLEDGKIGQVGAELEKQVSQAIRDGFTHFISGFADGVDLMFASTVVRNIQEGAPIYLEAAIPYAGRLDTKNACFQRLLPYCCKVHITSQQYTEGCFLQRNLYMLENSQRVIAVYDGRKRGGTYYTLNRAYSKGLDVRLIKV